VRDPAGTDERDVRAAKNESLFREINERVEDLNADFDAFAALAPPEWVCECSDLQCTEQVAMSVADYEHVRENGTHFLVAVGHERAGVDRIIESGDAYTVVRKVGVAGEIAKRRDPRAADGD
jgi:hypothetical protein